MLGLLEWACPEQLGLSSIACGLVLGDSFCPCTNEVSLFHRIASSASEKTADHILSACPIHRAPHATQGLTVWMTKLDAGLTTSLPASDPGSTAAWGNKRINPRLQSCLCLTGVDALSNNDDDDELSVSCVNCIS